MYGFDFFNNKNIDIGFVLVLFACIKLDVILYLLLSFLVALNEYLGLMILSYKGFELCVFWELELLYHSNK